LFNLINPQINRIIAAKITRYSELLKYKAKAATSSGFPIHAYHLTLESFQKSSSFFIRVVLAIKPSTKWGMNSEGYYSEYYQRKYNARATLFSWHK
jgi:hypothetical protein